MEIKFKKLSPLAKIPTRATEGAVGYDLYASQMTSIRQHGCGLIPTGIAIDFPKGWYATVILRSSMYKRGLVGSQGLIDNDYRGQVYIQACNITGNIVTFMPGDRVGQIIFHQYESPHLVETQDEISKTERGEGGFGSTGV